MRLYYFNGIYGLRHEGIGTFREKQTTETFLTTVEVRLDLLGEEIAAHKPRNSLAQEVSVSLEGVFLSSLMWTGTAQTM